MSETTSAPVPPVGINPPGGEPADPLAALRDIHLPPPVEAWPPAAGWWLLALIVTASCVLLVILGTRYWLAGRYRRVARAQLEELESSWQENHDSAALVTGVSMLLKRVALSVWPRADVAGLTGEAWVRFLDETLGTNEFSMGPGQVLIQGPYQQSPTEGGENLLKLAKRWIREHKRQRAAAPVGPAEAPSELTHA